MPSQLEMSKWDHTQKLRYAGLSGSPVSQDRFASHTGKPRRCSGSVRNRGCNEGSEIGRTGSEAGAALVRLADPIVDGLVLARLILIASATPLRISLPAVAAQITSTS
jgi:hypothetical protein